MTSSPTGDNGAGDITKKRKKSDEGRGATSMKKVIRARNNKKKTFPVEWNSKGQPIGDNSVLLMSYLGSTTRSIVPITSQDCDHVTNAYKEAIWEDVALTIALPEDKKSWIITEAGIKMRNFKSQLTRNWIYDDEGNVREEPPAKYKFIKQSQWTDFVQDRTSDKFKDISAANRDRAKENKYPKKRSRKGCARLEQELLSELAKSDNPSTSIPRGTMWMEMRRDKITKQISNDFTQEVANKIVSLSEQASQGEFEDSGRQDVLSRALEKEEHGGRVRGVGSGITITKYFGDLATQNEAQSEIKSLKSRIYLLEQQNIDLKAMMVELKAMFQGTQHENSEVNFPEVNQVIDKVVNIPEGLTTCKLALSSPSYRIVATGKVHNFPNEAPILHGLPIPSHHVRVSIDYADEEEALLPVPIIDEAYTVIEALGTHVAWPEHLIILDEMESVPNKQTKSIYKPPEENAQILEHVQSKQRVTGEEGKKSSMRPNKKAKLIHEKKQGNRPKTKPLFVSQLQPDDDDVIVPTIDILPGDLKITFIYAKRMTKTEQIKVPIDKGVFNMPKDIFFGKEEIFQLLAQDEIGACHVTAYILMLSHECLILGKASYFRFLCPFSIAPVVQSKRKELVQQNRVDRTRYIVNTLQASAKKGMVFLAPYNAGYHWVLCVIDSFHNMVYYLDHLGGNEQEIREDLTSMVDTALLIYRNRILKQTETKKITTWRHIQCPRQTNNKDCGYYVLRFMKEIVDHKSTQIPKTYFPDIMS